MQHKFSGPVRNFGGRMTLKRYHTGSASQRQGAKPASCDENDKITKIPGSVFYDTVFINPLGAIDSGDDPGISVLLPKGSTIAR